MSASWRLVFLSLLIGGCGASSISMTYVATDTVRAEITASASRCPTGRGWLLEGLDSAVTILIWLPADSTATWVPISSGPRDRPRVVVQRLGRTGITTWLADSGRVTLTEAFRGYAGTFDVASGSQRASGSFRVAQVPPDTTACVPDPARGG